MSEERVEELQAALGVELELYGLQRERAALHAVWAEVAKAGRHSVDREDDYEDGSALLAMQRARSETWGATTTYLQGELDRLDRKIRESMAKRVPDPPGA